jgi:hypothetical protein
VLVVMRWCAQVGSGAGVGQILGCRLGPPPRKAAGRRPRSAGLQQAVSSSTSSTGPSPPRLASLCPAPAAEGFGMLTIMSVAPIISVLAFSHIRKPAAHARRPLSRAARSVNLSMRNRVAGGTGGGAGGKRKAYSQGTLQASHGVGAFDAWPQQSCPVLLLQQLPSICCGPASSLPVPPPLPLPCTAGRVCGGCWRLHQHHARQLRAWRQQAGQPERGVLMMKCITPPHIMHN